MKKNKLRKYPNFAEQTALDLRDSSSYITSFNRFCYTRIRVVVENFVENFGIHNSSKGLV